MGLIEKGNLERVAEGICILVEPTQENKIPFSLHTKVFTNMTITVANQKKYLQEYFVLFLSIKNYIYNNLQK